MVAGLGLVAPALPARPEGFRRAMTATQQLQALARMALLRSDTAGKPCCCHGCTSGTCVH